MKKEMVVCPCCGGEIPKDAPSCRHCGADERTGWSESAYLDGIDLPDDESYEEMVAKEFGGGEKDRTHMPGWKAIVGLAILAAFVLLILRTLW